MSYLRSFTVLAGFFIFASVTCTDDDCLTCLPDDEYRRIISDVKFTPEIETPRSRHLFIIIPVGLIALGCKLCIYIFCRRCRRGIPYRNLQQETSVVVVETLHPQASEMTHHENLLQVSVIPIPNTDQSTVLPAPAPGSNYPGCVPLTQPTDADLPPSYNEACSKQPPNKTFDKY